MISRAKKYVAVLLVFVCVCMIFSPQTAYAAEDSSQHETVKVGFFAKSCISINFPKRILQLKFRSIMLPCQKYIPISMEAGNHILFL